MCLAAVVMTPNPAVLCSCCHPVSASPDFFGAETSTLSSSAERPARYFFGDGPSPQGRFQKDGSWACTVHGYGSKSSWLSCSTCGSGKASDAKSPTWMGMEPRIDCFILFPIDSNHFWNSKFGCWWRAGTILCSFLPTLRHPIPRYFSWRA